MVDTGSEFSFISKDIANKLNLYILPVNKTVMLADPTQLSKVISEAVIDIVVNDKLYVDHVVSILGNLFVKMIIRKDFLKLHKSVTFNFDGEDAPLEFSEKSTPCNLTAMEVEPPLLFKNMSTDTYPLPRIDDMVRKKKIYNDKKNIQYSVLWT